MHSTRAREAYHWVVGTQLWLLFSSSTLEWILPTSILQARCWVCSAHCTQVFCMAGLAFALGLKPAPLSQVSPKQQRICKNSRLKSCSCGGIVTTVNKTFKVMQHSLFHAVKPMKILDCHIALHGQTRICKTA